MIRMEVDTRPPAGAVMETRLVTRHFPISFRVHDLGSCLAGTIHALLARCYTKGRDLFDLAWYLTHPDRPEPNLSFLGNTLKQTGTSGPEIGAETWRGILEDRISPFDWPAITRDVEPVLEDPGD